MIEAHGTDSTEDENLVLAEKIRQQVGHTSPVERFNDYTVVQKSGVWDQLRKQYETGFIGSLVELSTKIKEQTGVAISTMTLSRRLRSKDKRLVRKRKYLPEDFSADAAGKDESRAPSGDCYRSLSRRLCSTVMTVAEEGGVRQYTRTRVSPDGLKEYFRCNRCYFQRCKFGGGPVATVAAFQGALIGERHPQHHTNCKLVTVECAAVTAVDRESRLEVRAGQKDPKEAHNEAFERTVQLANSLSAPPGRKLSMTTMFPSWQRVRKSYYRHKRQGFHDAAMHNGSDGGEGEEAHCSAMVKPHGDDFATVSDEVVDVVGVFPSPIPSQRVVESSRNPSNIAVVNRHPPEHSSGFPHSRRAFTGAATEMINYSDGGKAFDEYGRGSPLPRHSSTMLVTDSGVSEPSTSRLVAGRRHYVIRNRRTGRITVCSAPPRRLCTASSDNGAVPSNANRLRVTSRGCVYDDRFDSEHYPSEGTCETSLDVTARQEPMQEPWVVLKPDAQTPPPDASDVNVESCDESGDDLAQSRRAQQHWAMTEEQSKRSQEPLEASKRTSGMTPQDDETARCGPGGDRVDYESTTHPSVKKELGAAERDRFAQMGESIADSLRGVYELSCDAGDRLQSEILEVMTKYKNNLAPDQS